MNENEQHKSEEPEEIADLDVSEAQEEDVRGGDISLSYGKIEWTYTKQKP